VALNPEEVARAIAERVRYNDGLRAHYVVKQAQAKEDAQPILDAIERALTQLGVELKRELAGTSLAHREVKVERTYETVDFQWSHVRVIFEPSLTGIQWRVPGERDPHQLLPYESHLTIVDHALDLIKQRFVPVDPREETKASE
jgi:hypothetical protein